MADYDLTTKIAPYLDRHMIFPLLEFISTKNIFSSQELLEAKLEKSLGTRMIDYAIEVYKELHPEEPSQGSKSGTATSAASSDGAKGEAEAAASSGEGHTSPQTADSQAQGQGPAQVSEAPPPKTFSSRISHVTLDYLQKRRGEVIAELKMLKTRVNDMPFHANQEIQERMAKSTDLRELRDYLAREHKFTDEHLQTLYQYGYILYDVADYPLSIEYLRLVRSLTHASDPLYAQASWGLLASYILAQNWDGALESLRRVKDLIDQNVTIPPVQQLYHRTWLMHWALFVFFNHQAGKDLIIDWFLYQPAYLNTLQTTCPHLLRYVTTAVLTQNYANEEKRHTVARDLARVLHMESAYAYSDPVTQLFESLQVQGHLELGGGEVLAGTAAEAASGPTTGAGAGAGPGGSRFALCRTVLTNDFFLCSNVNEFLENARLHLFEIFCRIHHCISISMLSSKLSLSVEEAERWIVNLIRKAGLDARIDSKLGHVIMGVQSASLHDLVIQRTKTLAFRTQLQIAHLQKRLEPGAGGAAPGPGGAGSGFGYYGGGSGASRQQRYNR